MIKKSAYIFITIFIIGLTSCGKFSRIVKSTDLTEKYKAAEAYYQKGDYYHAQQLFDELVTYYRGTTVAEKIYYYYAYGMLNLLKFYHIHFGMDLEHGPARLPNQRLTI